MRPAVLARAVQLEALLSACQVEVRLGRRVAVPVKGCVPLRLAAAILRLQKVGAENALDLAPNAVEWPDLLTRHRLPPRLPAFVDRGVSRRRRSAARAAQAPTRS